MLLFYLASSADEARSPNSEDSEDPFSPGWPPDEELVTFRRTRLIEETYGKQM